MAASGLCTAAPATEQQPTVATCTQATAPHSAHCAALAHIPANAEFWAAANVSNILSVYARLAPGETLPPMAYMVDSVAFSVTDETPEMINQAGDLMAEAMQYIVGKGIAEWSEYANDSAGPALAAYASGISSPQAEAATERSLFKMLINTPLPGAYAAVTVTPGNEVMLPMVQEKIQRSMEDEFKGNCELYKGNGWTGVRLFMADPKKLFRHGPTPTDDEAAQLNKRSYYIVSRIEGNTLIFATADSAEKLLSVSCGAPSILSTGKVAGLDTAAQGNMLASCYLGQDTLNAYSGFYLKALQSVANTFNGALASVASADPSKKDATMQAITGMNNLVAEISKLYATQNHPLTITAWHDNNLHLELACDASGMEFTKAKVNTTCPQNALIHAYGSTIRFNNLPSFSTIVTSAGQVTDGIAETLPLHQGMSVKGWARMLKMAPPIAAVLAEPVLKMYNGLGNGWTLNVNLGHTSFGEVIPVISGSITLNDRKLFEEGWYDTRCIIVGLAAMDGERTAKKVAKALTFDATTIGNATVYTNKMLANDECQFAYAITDDQLSLTSQASQIGTTLGAPTEEVAGITVNVDLRPILPTLQEEYEKALAEANADEEYGSYYHEHYLPGVQERNRKAEQFINNIISGGKINITTEGGKLRTVVDIYTPTLK